MDPTPLEQTPAEEDRRDETAGFSSGGDVAPVRGSKRLGPRPPRIPGLRILGELGRGGMGAVYLAEHEASGKRVAVKVLLQVDERRVKRFEREIEAMQRIDHPHVVALVASGRVGEKPYLAMDYVKGGDLDDALGRALPLRHAVRVVAQSARAVAAAHKEGILHRDLKPANILIDEAGQARVTDFGLAKILDHESRLTRSNATVGTPYFMAPEQIRGGTYTGAVDSYALGVILYMAITGGYPFDAEDKVSLFRAILAQPPTPPWKESEDCPRDLGEIVLWALQKRPEDRPTCSELADALEAHLEGRDPWAENSERARKRLSWILGGLVGVGLTLGAVGLGVAAARRHEAQASQAELDAWLVDVRKAAAKARRARSGRETKHLLRELAAYSDLNALLAETPPAAREEVELKTQKARERRTELYRLLVPRLIAAGEVGRALELADQRVAIEGPTPAARAARVRALASVPAQAGAALKESHDLLTEPPSEPRALRDLAGAFLALGRPSLASQALAGAPRELFGLRARARERAGDLAGALNDVRALRTEAQGDVGLATAEARLKLRQGDDPRAVLAALDELPGGALGAWHLSRAWALEALGQTAAARAACREAIRLDPSHAYALPRMYQRLGLRRAAEALLAELPDPEAQLDLAVSRWIGGEAPEPTLKVLEGLVQDAERGRASLAVGAAADRWIVRVEMARGQYAGGLALAERIGGEGADPRDVATLAWAAWRADDEARAEAALARVKPGDGSSDAAVVRAWLAEAARSPSADRLREAVSRDRPARASLDLASAERREEASARQAALAQTAHRAWIRGSTPGAPPGVPVASEESLQVIGRLVERLGFEARLLLAYPRGTPELERAARLFERALALDPHALAAELELAGVRQRVAAYDRLVAAHPWFPEARRRRVLLVSNQARGRMSPAQAALVREDIAVLAEDPGLAGAERAAVASVLRANGQDDRAWAILRDGLAEPARDLATYTQAREMAKQRGDEAEHTRLAVAVKEIEATRRESARLFEEAYYGEDQAGLSRAMRALRRIERDLPLTSQYWSLKAMAWLGQGALGQALMCGGEYAVRREAMWADSLSLWIHAYGWTPEGRPNMVFDLVDEHVARDPGAAAPWVSKCLFLLARYNLSASRDLEDLDDAALAALYALQLRPRASGVLGVAADVLISAGELAEGQALVDAALAADSGNQFARLQAARLCAWKRDVKGALAILRRLGHLDRPKLRRLLRGDVVLSRISDTPDYREFLKEHGG